MLPACEWGWVGEGWVAFALSLGCCVVALCHLGVACTVEASEAKVLPACEWGWVGEKGRVVFTARLRLMVFTGDGDGLGADLIMVLDMQIVWGVFASRAIVSCALPRTADSCVPPL